MRDAVLSCALALAAIFAEAQPNTNVKSGISVTLKHMQSADCKQQKDALSRAEDLLASDESTVQEKERLREGVIQMLNGENARLIQSRNNPKRQQYGRPSACPGGDEENDPEFEFHSDLVAVVAQFDEDCAIPALVGAIVDPNADKGLIKYGDKALGPVLEQLKNPDEWTRLTALSLCIRLLEMHADPASNAEIMKLIRLALADSKPVVRTHAVREISCLSDRQEYVPMLEQLAMTDPFKLPGRADDGGDGHEFYPVRANARSALRDIHNNATCKR